MTNTTEQFTHAPHQTYPVVSSFLKTLTFGTLTIGSDSFNAVMVDFLNGTQYLYFGLSDKVVTSLQDACDKNLEHPEQYRVSPAFHKYLQPYPVYSRMNKSI